MMTIVDHWLLYLLIVLRDSRGHISREGQVSIFRSSWSPPPLTMSEGNSTLTHKHASPLLWRSHFGLWSLRDGASSRPCACSYALTRRARPFSSSRGRKEQMMMAVGKGSCRDVRFAAVVFLVSGVAFSCLPQHALMPPFPEAGFSKNYCAKNSGSSEVELRLCPWLILFKYCTGRPGFSICPYYVIA